VKKTKKIGSGDSNFGSGDVKKTKKLGVMTPILKKKTVRVKKNEKLEVAILERTFPMGFDEKT